MFAFMSPDPDAAYTVGDALALSGEIESFTHDGETSTVHLAVKDGVTVVLGY